MNNKNYFFLIECLATKLGGRSTFAKSLGVSKPAVNKWCTNTVFPKQRYSDLAQVLGLSVARVADLFDWAGALSTELTEAQVWEKLETGQTGNGMIAGGQKIRMVPILNRVVAGAPTAYPQFKMGEIPIMADVALDHSVYAVICNEGWIVPGAGPGVNYPLTINGSLPPLIIAIIFNMQSS